MSTGKVILGTVAGLAVGAILGVLFAPDKGSATRKKIIDKGHDYADGLTSKCKDIVNSISETFQSAKEDAQEFVDKGKAKFDEFKQEVKDAASNT
jgi:gas vesicle protein